MRLVTPRHGAGHHHSVPAFHHRHARAARFCAHLQPPWLHLARGHGLVTAAFAALRAGLRALLGASARLFLASADAHPGGGIMARQVPLALADCAASSVRDVGSPGGPRCAARRVSNQRGAEESAQTGVGVRADGRRYRIVGTCPVSHSPPLVTTIPPSPLRHQAACHRKMIGTAVSHGGGLSTDCSFPRNRLT